MDRFYELLRDQGNILRQQEKTLATISQAQLDTHERLFGANGQPGIIQVMHTDVSRHTRQISFWRGGLAVVTFLWAAAMAFGSVMLGKHR